MIKSQLNNLIRFALNFNKHMDIEIENTSPDYIKEKWDKFIGIDPYKEDLGKFFNDSMLLSDWKKRWHVETGEYDKILFLIFNLNEKLFDSDFGLYGLIELYSSYINIDDVNTHESFGLHPLVEDVLNTWLNSKSNKRLYNILQLENKF